MYIENTPTQIEEVNVLENSEILLSYVHMREK